jgi:ferredoxin
VKSERIAERALRAIDAAATRMYGWRYNPLHQSGTIAFAMLLVLIVTGLFLLVFYRVSAPWASVERLVNDPWLGRWIRSLHRFASDAMVIAVVIHAFRMLAQARSWGPRALAWISGVVLLLFVFVSGWTGFVIVWDTFGARLAIEGARLFDALPVLSEPVRRIFSGERPIPGAFFFINLFLHVAIPLGVAAGLWIHVSRVARSMLFPPRPLAVALIGGLTLLAILWPAPLPPEANPFALATSTPNDFVYSFWLPWSERLPEWAGWAGASLTFVAVLTVPRIMRRPREGTWAPTFVDERLCTGCNQCPQDCPWEAITMQARTDDRPTLVAHVNPALCVSWPPDSRWQARRHWSQWSVRMPRRITASHWSVLVRRSICCRAPATCIRRQSNSRSAAAPVVSLCSAARHVTAGDAKDPSGWSSASIMIVRRNCSRASIAVASGWRQRRLVILPEH